MKKHIIGAALASLLALPALAQNIAIVNGKAIPTSRADALKKQVEASGQAVTPEIMAKIKDELITREIFMQEAKKRALDATDEYKNQLELARQSILIRTLLADVQKKSAVSDAEIQAEYDKFVKENAGQEIRSRHILVETEAQAKDLIAQISKGAKFEDLAKKHSKDPGSGANGGDLDWANPAGFVPEFSAAMVKLGKGQMTDAPVKSQFGWHIIRVEDIRETQLPKLDEVKAQITQQLQQQKLAKFQDDLRAKAKIQ
ncbi:peptidylprolyl isomerase [Limnohabitans sp.]|jgi:peptidyl-prolyl cis-trans isomerase C|uniref:peptidylprolyl isomerase n=1 Tax=Limnohabitans sp. TaxID=1907725 RepID=UPI00311DE0F9